MFIKPDHKFLQYSGRIDDSNPQAPVFVFPASMVTMRFRGSEIRVLLENTRQYWDNYMGVILDGAQSKICLTSDISLYEETSGGCITGRSWYVIAQDLPDTEHTLTLFKRQDGCHEVSFLGFELPDGAQILAPMAKPERRIEVYGDSVSAGEVSEAVEYTGKPDPEHSGEYSNVWYSYAWTAARKLNAELHDIAQGGIALLDDTGYFNAPDYLGMENCWDKLHYNPAYGPITEWDFSRYIPHVVVVAIGQNDANPSDFMKEEPEGAKAQLWKQRYKNMIAGIRERYRDALIILTTTILNHDKAWDNAIEEVCRSLGDDRIVHFLYKRNGCGTPGHIRIGEADEMAEELVTFIKGFGEEIWHRD